MSMIDNLETLLASGQDNATLRFSLGNAYIKAGKLEQAVTHLRAALKHDPHYSAAWKLLGGALAEMGDAEKAVEVYTRGIEVAEAKGDKQPAKEMQVFKRRLERAQEN